MIFAMFQVFVVLVISALVVWWLYWIGLALYDMLKLSNWVAYHKRVIYDREETSPYLTRYYLIGRPKMPDGSPPFDSIGRVREGAVWPRGWGLYIHCFHRSDSSDDLHSHPWQWALSWILRGGYSEERRVCWYCGSSYCEMAKHTCVVDRREVKPGHLNFLRSDTFHRVDLHCKECREFGVSPCQHKDVDLPRPCWSLFLAGPKFTSWGFWNRETGQFTPWREYLGLDPKLPEDY